LRICHRAGPGKAAAAAPAVTAYKFEVKNAAAATGAPCYFAPQAYKKALFAPPQGSCSSRLTGGF